MQRNSTNDERPTNTRKIFQVLNAEKKLVEIPEKQFAEKTFMDEIVKEVKSTFVVGNINNKRLRKRAKENPADYSQFNLEHYMYMREPYFSYHANRIPGTNFIAAAGPRDSTKESFLANTIDNPKLPIHDIVALTSCMAYSDWSYQDCYDYILKPREETWGQYRVKINEPQGKYDKSLSGHQVYPRGIVTNTLEVTSALNPTSKKLNVTLFSLEDNNSLNLQDEATREKLWNIYQTSLKRPVLVHCASGVGRTGHLILTLVILTNYDKVFASNDTKTIVQEINKIIANMRSVRPALVNTEIQLETAIRNARILHNHYLSNHHAAVVSQTVGQDSSNMIDEKLTSSLRLSR